MVAKTEKRVDGRKEQESKLWYDRLAERKAGDENKERCGVWGRERAAGVGAGRALRGLKSVHEADRMKEEEKDRRNKVNLGLTFFF